MDKKKFSGSSRHLLMNSFLHLFIHSLKTFIQKFFITGALIGHNLALFMICIVLPVFCFPARSPVNFLVKLIYFLPDKWRIRSLLISLDRLESGCVSIDI